MKTGARPTRPAMAIQKESRPRAPRRRQAFSVFGGAIETWGEAAFARVAGKLFELDPGLSRALTHGFHSYAGRMHPSTARGALAAWSKQGQCILDPFCGSGTVLVEAMAAGRGAIGVDASPLAVLIAKVRSSVLDEAERTRLVETARAIATEAAERARKRVRPEIPGWAERENSRFFPHVALELLGLRELVMATAEDAVGTALRACLSSILVKFMRQQDPRATAPQRIGRGGPSKFFAGRAEELASALAGLAERTPSGTPAPRIHLGDARAIEVVPDRSCDMVVSSPPYAGTYDYAEHHDVRFLWLGLPRDRFDRVQVGARTEELGSSLGRWRKDRRRWLGEIGRVAKDGAVVVLVMGDGVVGGEPEDAAEAMRLEAPKAGLAVVAGAFQARPPRDRRLAAVFAGRTRREHILVLRKG
jgi:16S rRNA G966 N2-methylase RsmD